MCIQAAAFSPFFDPWATSKRFFQTFNEANFLFSLNFFCVVSKIPKSVHCSCTVYIHTLLRLYNSWSTVTSCTCVNYGVHLTKHGKILPIVKITQWYKGCNCSYINKLLIFISSTWCCHLMFQNLTIWSHKIL